MKRVSILLVLAVLALTSCYRVSPNAGEESVLVYKPYFFGHGGVDETPISTGATWCIWTTQSVEFNITPLNIQEDFEVVMTKDNTPLGMMVNIQLQAIKGQTPMLYKNYGIDWYKNNVQPYFRTICRDKVSEFELFELASKRETSSKIETYLLVKMQDYVKKNNIPISVSQIAMAGIVPPNEVLEETKKTAAQNQAILTQKSRADAELSRKQAEINKAIADQAYKMQMGMTIEEYLSLRHLEIEKEKVELIKDNKNISIIFGNANPVFPIK